MERIKDINIVQEGDLMYYQESLSVVAAVDIPNKTIYTKLENGELGEVKIHDFTQCTFFRGKSRF